VLEIAAIEASRACDETFAQLAAMLVSCVECERVFVYTNAPIGFDSQIEGLGQADERHWCLAQPEQRNLGITQG
jgi:hypothetical protein